MGVKSPPSGPHPPPSEEMKTMIFRELKSAPVGYSLAYVTMNVILNI